MTTMDAGLTRIRVRVSEALVGAVSAELSRRGVWLDELQAEHGVSIITARAPRDQLPTVTAWLGSFTSGAGSIEALAG